MNALELANSLESGLPVTGSAAAELRRLHAINAELVEALESIAADTYDQWSNGARAKRTALSALEKTKQ